jgi:hypothetical protein
MKTLHKLIEGDFIVKLLLWTAVLVFAINLIMASLPAFKIMPEHIVTGCIGVLLALVKALPQPAILLGLAKIIDMKQAKAHPNA